MANVPRFRLKQTPTDIWSVRERLALACSVMRSGDQNWVSVSRAIKPFGEPNRPPDWFSQKNCALQYADLLEKVETPKRKRADRSETETPGAQITRKLTIERIEELKQLVKEEQQKYKKLKLDLEACKAGQYDDKIKETWDEMLADKKAKEEAAAAAIQKAKEDAEARAAALARVPGKPVAIPNKPKKNLQGLKLKIGAVSEDDSTQDSIVDDDVLVGIKVEDESSNLSMGSLFSSQQADSCSTPPTTTSLDVTKPSKLSPPRSPILSTLLESSKELQKAIQAQHQREQEEQEQEQDDQDTEQEDQQDDKTQADVEMSISVGQSELSELNLEPEDMPIKQEEEEESSQIKSGKSDDSSSTEPAESRCVSEDTVVADESVVMETWESPAAAVVSLLSSVSAKSEAPSSPSVGAPTLSRLLVTPPIVAPVSTKAVSIQKTPVTIPAPPTLSVTEVVREPRINTGGGKTHTARTREKSESSDRDDIHPAPPQHTGGKGPLLSMQPDIDDPASPASSVVSNETDSGSTKTTRSTGRKGRGKGRPSLRRSSGRLRSRNQEEHSKDGETGSKQSDAETSDDETTKDESDEMPMTPRAHTSISESIPNSPAQSFSSDTEDEKAHRVWKKSIMLVWRAAANHKYANVFLHPVTDDIAPGYSIVVSRPMDLMTIKRNVETGLIRTTAEFQRDVMLMFTNAIMYNNSDHNVYNMALEMYDDVLNHIEYKGFAPHKQACTKHQQNVRKQFVNTQMMVSAEQKVLRPSRRSEAAMSDKEDDPKKRKIPELEAGGKAKKRK